MKYFILLLIMISTVTMKLEAQEIIATSYSPDATANHNQRKIVRTKQLAKEIYVVYEDVIQGERHIKLQYFDVDTDTWIHSVDGVGNSPTIAISQDEVMHIVYVSNDSIPRILYRTSTDWSRVEVLSDTLHASMLPVADIDSSGVLNVFWKQNNDYYTNYSESLIYAKVERDDIQRRRILTKQSINDIAVANHLQYYRNELILGVQFDQDSILFIGTKDYMKTLNMLYRIKGTHPCITFNSQSAHFSGYSYIIRLLYINTEEKLVEVETSIEKPHNPSGHILHHKKTDFVCVDDLVPPLGYSYLFMQDDTLYHGFSFGSYPSSMILDTVSSEVLHPSIAYKQFRFGHIDYIWMESAGDGTYNIMYKRDDKYVDIIEGVADDRGSGISITGFPNPFIDQLSITITGSFGPVVPIVKVYNTEGTMVKEIELSKFSEDVYQYIWDGTDSNGYRQTSGMYVLHCRIGKKKTARKVILINE